MARRRARAYHSPRVKLLIDMNLSPRWRETVQSAEIAVAHWSRIGRADAPDAEIMAYAAAHDHVILTHDLDFGAILAATHGRKPSVVQLRADDVSPEAAGETVLAAIHQCRDELTDGALLTVDVARFRLSLLPLRT